MKDVEIVKFLKETVEPLSYELTETIYGKQYRAAAYLRDGTYLPCVVFQSKQKRADLAIKRFEELKNRPDQFRMALESFVAGGSSISFYNIDHVELSPFAWPQATLRNIHGETVMSWTAFVVEMHDGRKFSYGTPFNFEFFDLPDGYRFNDIKQIHSGMLYSESDGLQSFSMERHAKIKYYRDKPFFTCYIDGLDG